METKRCVLYIIRIQTGPDLLSIMVKPVTDDDEDRWAALIQEEILPDNDRQRSAYTDTASPLIDIASLSYTELKRTALENVLTLEQTGRITRDNKYQDLLNDIAIDIRTKHRRRIQRSREMENIRATLTALDSKSEWLDSQLKSYNNYIEQAMITLQSKKGKKRFLLPFTKQYNHERELQRRGQVPKFGSFKYSARALGEKGVLVEWRGYTDRDRGWEKTNVTISSDQVGIFLVPACGSCPSDSDIFEEYASKKPQYMLHAILQQRNQIIVVVGPAVGCYRFVVHLADEHALPADSRRPFVHQGRSAAEYRSSRCLHLEGCG